MVDLPFPRVSAPAAPDAGVRRARPGDVGALADLQRTAWRAAYADLLSPEALAALEGADLEEQWSLSVTAPPSLHHVVLVATSGSDVVGFAVVVPDLDPAGGEATGELSALVVGRPRAGHGSRLLAAGVDHLREHGYAVLCTWCDEDDDARRTFLESAGLGADGAVRRLDAGDGTGGLLQHRYAARLD